MGANWGLLNSVNEGVAKGIDAFIDARRERDAKLERQQARADRLEDRDYQRKRDSYGDAFKRLEARKSGYNMDEEGNFSETESLLKKQQREEAAGMRTDELHDPNSKASNLERELKRGLLKGSRYGGLIRDDMSAAQTDEFLKDAGGFLSRESAERVAAQRRNATTGAVGSPQNQFKVLPKENQIEIEKIAGSSAGKKAIMSAIESDLALLNDAKINDEQKLVHARSMIKTLNSQQGQDAVGAEEAKRLAALLEFNLINLQQPGPKGIWPFGAGRAPISEFTTQATNIRDSLRRAVENNDREVDKLYGRSPKSAGAGGKPKTVIQNGHTYTLNEATGAYE